MDAIFVEEMPRSHDPPTMEAGRDVPPTLFRRSAETGVRAAKPRNTGPLRTTQSLTGCSPCSTEPANVPGETAAVPGRGPPAHRRNSTRRTALSNARWPLPTACTPVVSIGAKP
jgi:hypothetical protein